MKNPRPWDFQKAVGLVQKVLGFDKNSATFPEKTTCSISESTMRMVVA